MTVVQLLVVSTSQLVFSHAWTTGPIQYLTDDRPAISWTCRHEHLSTLQNPPFLSPYFPPGRNPDSHRMSLKQWHTKWDCINRFCYGSSFTITQTRFFSSIPSISDRAVESFLIIGWFLRSTTVNSFQQWLKLNITFWETDHCVYVTVMLLSYFTRKMMPFRPFPAYWKIGIEEYKEKFAEKKKETKNNGGTNATKRRTEKRTRANTHTHTHTHTNTWHYWLGFFQCFGPRSRVRRTEELKSSLVRTQRNQSYSFSKLEIDQTVDVHAWPAARKYTFSFHSTSSFSSLLPSLQWNSYSCSLSLSGVCLTI